MIFICKKLLKRPLWLLMKRRKPLITKRNKGEFLCIAERVTKTHPMAKLLGDVKDYEDYKQKIVKQRQLRKKTINSVKQYLNNEEGYLKRE